MLTEAAPPWWGTSIWAGPPYAPAATLATAYAARTL